MGWPGRIAAYAFAPFVAGEREIKALHGLRALSILGIIVYHTWDVASHAITWMPDLPHRFLRNLTTTVNLFFMLSGYLITSGLLVEWKKRGRIDFKEFYLKRTFRIFPSYYILVFFMIAFIGYQIKVFEAIPALTPDQQIALDTMHTNYANRWWDLFYLSNFIRDRMVEHGWTLSIEEQYYLVFPLLASVILFRAGRRMRLGLVLTLYLVPLIARLAYLYVFVSPDSGFQVYYYSHARFDSIVVGVAIAVFIHDWRDVYDRLMERHAGKVALSALVLYVLRHLWNVDERNFENAIAYNVADIAYGGMILVGIHGRNWLARLLSIAPLIPVAKVSYSMYLWHWIMTGMALSAVYRPGQPVTVSMLLLMIGSAILRSFVTAWVLFLMVEAPFMKLRDMAVARLRRGRNREVGIAG